MIVVADTSPLNYLIRLGRPDVLHKIYGHVLVPHAVLIEMQHPEASLEVRAWASAPPLWLEERQVERVDESLAAGTSRLPLPGLVPGLMAGVRLSVAG